MKIIIAIIIALMSAVTSAKNVCYEDGDIRCYSEADSLETLLDFIAYVETEHLVYVVRETGEYVIVTILNQTEK